MSRRPTALEFARTLRDAGWELGQRSPGCIIATDPVSDIEHPTPPEMPKRWWPFPTYRALRQIQFTYDGETGRLHTVWTRERPVPWVTPTEHQVSMRAAYAYIDATRGQQPTSEEQPAAAGGERS